MRLENGGPWPLTIAAALCAIFATASCSGGDDAPSGVAVRDSAGITIVENTAPAWPEEGGWHLSETPELEIGVFEGDPEYQFYRAIEALRLEDGRIVVANAGTHELRFYDAAGRYLGSSGREGGGPGEFKNLRSLLRLPGDSLLTWDWGNARASVFDSEENFVRSFKLDVGGEGAAFPRPVGVFAEGTLLTTAGGVFTPDSRPGVSRDSSLYLEHDREGALIDTIGRLPRAEYYLQTWGAGAISVTSLPFGLSPQLQTWGDGFYYGTTEVYELGYYSSDGDLQRLIRKTHLRLPVTDADIERMREERLEGTDDEGWRQRLQQMLSEMPFPERMPAHAGIRVDAAGNLWVGEYRRPGDDQPRWNVFDTEGRWLGTVETPPRFAIDQIGDDFVLGRYRDELDVEYVRLYELIKPIDTT